MYVCIERKAVAEPEEYPSIEFNKSSSQLLTQLTTLTQFLGDEMSLTRDSGKDLKVRWESCLN